MKNIHAFGALLALSMTLQFAPVHAANGAGLVYVAVDPCRIVDTRKTIGAIPTNSTADFVAYGDAGELGAQGGEAEGCPHPKMAQGIKPVAIAANFTVVATSATGGNGYLLAYPADGVLPTSSLVNYSLGTNIANSTILKLCQGESCTADFTVSPRKSGVPVIVDVQGYYYETPGGIAHVALSGGDYISPVDAMNDLENWCGTPSETNRCLIKIAPGVYDIGTEQVAMQEWVSIQGAGQDVTKITGNRGFFGGSIESTAILVSVVDTNLTDLTIENRSDRDGSKAVSAIGGNYRKHPRIERVTVLGTNGIVSDGARMVDVTAIVPEDISVQGTAVYMLGYSTAVNLTAIVESGWPSSSAVLADGYAHIQDSIMMTGAGYGLAIQNGAVNVTVVNSKIMSAEHATGGLSSAVYDGAEYTQCKGNYTICPQEQMDNNSFCGDSIGVVDVDC